MRKVLNFIKKLWLYIRYYGFTSGKYPIKIQIYKDFLADKYSAENTRMIKIGTKLFILTFEYMETDKNGDFIGHYYLLYTSQYISFKSYYELSLIRDHKIKIKF